MAGRAPERDAVVGVADHAGWAVLVTATGAGVVLDRRRVELVTDGLPKLPHHHECQSLPTQDAVALVGRVRESAEGLARDHLAGLATVVVDRIRGIALRASPPLPETIEARIADYRAQCVADTVMYRQALADAAAHLGWDVHTYVAKQVLSEAAAALGREGIDDLLAETGATLGPPWRKDHRIAMAAAIASARRVP